MLSYRREVDGLRALAVLPVIFFHAGFESFSGGFVGVDVFFVISGYLIISLVLAEKQAGTFSLARFYERRARRIFPALFLVMLACTPLAWLWFTPGDAEEFSESVIFASLFSSNLFFWTNVGYFDTAAEVKPLLHTWSLAIEEQFYVLFPLFLLLTWRLGLRVILALLIFAAAASFALAEWGSQSWPTATFYLLPTRGWELLVGGAIAFYLNQHPSRAWSPARAAASLHQAAPIVGLLLIAWSVFTFDADTPFPGVYALAPTAGTALIILFAGPRTLVGRLLSCKSLVGLGLISYSLYLWHLPLFVFARYGRVEKPGALFFIALSCLAVVMAYFSWRYVEQPFRRRGGIGARQVFSLAGATALLLLTFGTVGHLTSGLLNVKMNDLQRQMLESAASSPRMDCHTGGADYVKPADACEYFEPDVRWAVLGDSHAVNLAYALAQALQEQGTGLKHLSFSACVPSYGREAVQDNCARWTKEAVEYIVGAPQIETVVVTYRINAWLFGEHEEHYPALPEGVSRSERQAVWASLMRTIRALRAAGKNVIYVMQAPELKARAETLIFKHGTSVTEIAGMEHAWWNKRNAYVAGRKRELARHALVIDPAELVCDAESCYAVRKGVALYSDDDHLSVAGARQVAQQILERSGARCVAGKAGRKNGAPQPPASPITRRHTGRPA